MKVLLILGTTLMVSLLLTLSTPAYSLTNIQNKTFHQQSRRTLATSNSTKVEVCESEGLDTNAGLFDSGDEERYKKNKDKLIKADGNPFKQFFIDEDQDKAIQTFTSSNGLPIVLMLLFILFSYPLGYICYYCCACMPDRCCPPCKICCKKCLCIQCNREEPYAGFSKLWPIVGMFVFLGWMAIAAIIGLAYTSGIEESFKKFRCATINFLYTVNAGKGSEWGGIDGMYNTMVQLDNDLAQIKIDIGTNLEGCSVSTSASLCLTTQKTALTTANGNLALSLTDTTTFKNLLNADVTVATIFDSDGNYQINPRSDTPTTERISGFFGKVSGTSAYDTLVQGMGTLTTGIVNNIDSSLGDIASAGNTIKTDSSFETAIGDGIEAIQDQQEFMQDQQESLYDSTQTPADFMAQLTMILNAIFGGFLGLALVVALFGALMVAFNWYKIRILLHLCWALFTLLTLVAMVIAVLLYGLSVFGFGGCDYIGYDVFKWDVENPSGTNAEWENLNDKIFKLSGKTEDIAVACFRSLGGNGDIFTPLGIKDELSKFDTIFDFKDQQDGFEDSIDEVNVKITSVKSVFVQLFSLSTFTIDGTTTNEHQDLAGALTLANNALSARTERFYSNNQGAVTTSVDYNPLTAGGSIYWIGDIWVDNGTAGVVDSSDLYARSDYSTRTAEDQRLKTTSTSGTAAFDTVYTTHVVPILTWRDHKDAMAMRQLKLVLAYETAFAALETKINTAFTNINTALTALDTKLNAVVDPTDGLLGTKNKCFFIGEGVDDTLKSICWGFFPSLYLVAETLIFIAVGMSLASFFLCCTSMRYAKNQRLQNMINNNKVDSAKTGGK